jgi:hypothetical protein
MAPNIPGEQPVPGGGGRGEYLVGTGQPFSSIQAAIDALVAEQGADPFTATQRITITDNGVYEPFRIESDSLTPTDDCRLVIEGGQGKLPIVSGRKNPSKSGVGGLVGNNVPYVTVRRLFFRDLIKGVVFGVNSHRSIVNQCMFLDCGNVSVWFYQADQCVLANSILVNCEHGIAATKTKDVVVIHNTFFNDAFASRNGKKTYCLFLDLQDDRGQGVEDTGLAYVYDNIVFSKSDFGILLYEKDVKNLRSDWNDWYCTHQGDAGGLAEIRENLINGVVTRELISSLHTNDAAQSDLSWRLRTGQDSHSVAEDPSFVKPAATKESPSLDLGLRSGSHLFGKGKLGYTLPAWVDDLIPYYDFENKQRLTLTPAIGALETACSIDLGQTLPFGTASTADAADGAELPSLDDCADTVTPVDSAVDRYANAIPVWLPKVHKGPFFVRDAEYHLFVEKKGFYIRDLQRTSFPLSGIFIEEGAKVYVSGQEVTTTATWWIDGYVFVLQHAGIDDLTEATEVELHAYQRTWNVTADQFETKLVKHRWKISQGVQSYVFPENPVIGEPIVVTDDLLVPGNALGLKQEFRTVRDEARDETRLEFAGPKNLWANPDFSYVDEDLPHANADLLALPYTGYEPLSHHVEGSAFIATIPAYRTAQGLDFSPLRGPWALAIGTGDLSSFVAQRVQVDPSLAYTFSAYAAGLDTGLPGDLRVSFEFIDRDGVLLGTYGPYGVELPAQSGVSVAWRRFGCSIYGEADTTLNRKAFSEYAYPLTEGIEMPASAHEVVVKIHPGTGAVPAVLDACQLEAGYRPGLFTRIPMGTDMTVECELADRRFHVVDDLSIQPVHNAQTRGFLSILPIPAHQWDPDAPTGATTLSDYRWPWGRINLLPWARTSGFNKYRRTPFFSTEERSSWIEPSSIPEKPALPADIRIYPSTVYARQGSEGELVAIEVFDEDGNPYAFERIRATVQDNTGEFPGYLAQKEWDVYTQLGASVSAQLSEAGAISLLWIPPSEEEISYRGPKPTTYQVSLTGQPQRDVGYVDTFYEIDLANHGNVVLEDEEGTQVSLVGSDVSGSVLGQYSEDGRTYVGLPSYPIPGTVRVRASLTGEPAALDLMETFTEPVPERHFLVNYENGGLVLEGLWQNDLVITYRPRTAWIDPAYPRRVYFDKAALDMATGTLISVHYDAVIKLLVEALVPTGMPEEAKTTFLMTDLIAQHAHRSVP